MFENLADLAGKVICGLVAFQMFAYCLRSIRQFFADSKANRLRIEKLNSEIELLRKKHRQKEQSLDGWAGLRKFRVDRKIHECNNVHSIYLVPHDGKPLPSYLPGQYLTFQLKISGEDKPVVRCYSLSDAPGRQYYRCSIKKALPPRDQHEAPSGVSSTYMNEVLKVGDILDVKSPRGGFFLDLEDDKPVVMLAGGIGITPMASMLNTLALTGSQRNATLFYGVCHSGDHVLRQELEAICENNDNLNQVVFYSKPLETDQKGRDYDVGDRISVDYLQARLGDTFSHADYFLVGPPPFMDALVSQLEEAGIPKESIKTEAFGPSSVRKSKPEHVPANQGGETPAVKFDRTSRTVSWDDEFDSLLEFAESLGIEIESGCRSGNCGACALAVKSGEVEYFDEPGTDVENGTCLPCVSTPKSSIVLDA